MVDEAMADEGASSRRSRNRRSSRRLSVTEDEEDNNKGPLRSSLGPQCDSRWWSLTAQFFPCQQGQGW